MGRCASDCTALFGIVLEYWMWPSHCRIKIEEPKPTDSTALNTTLLQWLQTSGIHRGSLQGGRRCMLVHCNGEGRRCICSFQGKQEGQGDVYLFIEVWLLHCNEEGEGDVRLLIAMMKEKEMGNCSLQGGRWFVELLMRMLFQTYSSMQILGKSIQYCCNSVQFYSNLVQIHSNPVHYSNPHKIMLILYKIIEILCKHIQIQCKLVRTMCHIPTCPSSVQWTNTQHTAPLLPSCIAPSCNEPSTNLCTHTQHMSNDCFGIVLEYYSSPK